MANHVLDTLDAGQMRFAEAGSLQAYPCDAATRTFLHSCYAALVAGGLSVAYLPNTRADIPVTLAAARAWDFQGRMGDNDVVVLVTRQRDAIRVANNHVFPRSTWSPKGRRNMLNVAQLTSRTNIPGAMVPRRHDVPVRLVITEAFTQYTAEALGVQRIRAVVVDGRSANLSDLHTPDGIPVLFLAVSRLQTPTGWKTLPVVKPDGNLTHRLASPRIELAFIEPHFVPDPFPRATELLGRLRGQPAANIFCSEGKNLVWRMHGFAVPAKDVASEFMPILGRPGHPAQASLQVLNAMASTHRDLGAKADMQQFTHEASQAVDALSLSCAKHDEIRGIVNRNIGGDFLIVVRGRGNQKALQEALTRDGVKARVVTWRDPVDWMPHPGIVILAGAPPPQWFWLLAPHCGPGRTFHIVLTPLEAGSLNLGVQRIHEQFNRKSSPLGDAVQQILKGPPGQALPPLPPLPVDLMTWLDDLSIAESNGGNGVVGPSSWYAFLLENGSRYYVGASSVVARFKASGILEVPTTEIRVGDVILVPNKSTTRSLRMTVLDAFEDKEPIHREQVIEWKRRLLGKAMSEGATDASDLLRILVNHGARGLTEGQVKDAFFRSDDDRKATVAPMDCRSLVNASKLYLADDFNYYDLPKHVERIRSIRQVAGKFLARYASNTYLQTAQELDERFEEEYGLTRDEVQQLVRMSIVKQVSGPYASKLMPESYLSENVNQ